MIGVIGGSGFYSFFGSDARSLNLDTPYGEPSAPITVGRVGTHEVAFLPRHGLSHQYSPHTVPYRANMWALRALGVFGRLVVIGFAAGSIASLPANQVLLKNRTVVGVDWGAWAMQHPAAQAVVLDEVLAAVRSGELRPVPPAQRRLVEAPAVLRDLLERRLTGKTVLVP